MSEDTHKPQRSEASNSADDRGMRSNGQRGDKDAPQEGGPRFKSKRRRKVSYLTLNKIDYVDYKEINILRRFLNDRGKILPSRQTGNTAKQQRMIASAIRKAREMALLPFTVTEMGTDRREYGQRRERSYDRPYQPRHEDREPRQERQQEQAAEPAAAATPEPVQEAPAPAAEATETATE